MTVVFAPNDTSYARLKVPIKIWTEKHADIDDNTLEQTFNLARHPLAFKHVALMPDFHLGYGMPIGGVMACMNGIIPNAVGNDIGCGMLAINTGVEAASLSFEDLQAWRKKTYELVPCGQGRYHKEDQSIPALNGDWDDFPIIGGTMWKTIPRMMGTLGEGNHFIELQQDEEGHLWVMIHSGSRGVGGGLCQHYSKLAQRLNSEWASDIPHKDLAFFPTNSTQGQDYIREMNWAMEFAEWNRLNMLEKTLAALQSVGVQADRLLTVHTHHNYAQQEHHFDADPWVHRKGAVKADGLVIIPGSMGTASYICEGLNNPESFGSCSHGAGRVMSRTVANKTITHERAVESMKNVVYGVRQGEYDEMPDAYKDVDAVIAAQADLVTPIHRLTPLAVVKG